MANHLIFSCLFLRLYLNFKNPAQVLRMEKRHCVFAHLCHRYRSVGLSSSSTPSPLSHSSLLSLLSEEEE